MIDKETLLKKLDDYMYDVEGRRYGSDDECEFYYHLWYSRGVGDVVMFIKELLNDKH